MKKHNAVIAILLILTFNLSAQDFGVRLGTNASILIGSDNKVFYITDMNGSEVGLQQKIGFNVGFYARLPINDNLFFYPDFGYSAKGFSNQKVVYQYIDAKFYRYDFSYIDISPLLQIGNHNYGAYLLIGPQVSYLAFSRRRLENEYTDIERITNKKTNKFALGAVAGLGYEWSIGLNFALRAEYNITPIAKGMKANILSLQGMLGFNISSLGTPHRPYRR